MFQASIICLVLLMQEMLCAFCLAFVSAGKSIAARMAMIAITTSNSMRVKPAWRESVFCCLVWGFIGFRYQLCKSFAFHPAKKQAPVLAGACKHCASIRSEERRVGKECRS